MTWLEERWKDYARQLAEFARPTPLLPTAAMLQEREGTRPVRAEDERYIRFTRLELPASLGVRVRF